MQASSILKLFEDQSAVGTTKAERIGHRNLDGHLPGRIRYIIEIAAFTRMIEIDGGRSNAVAHGKQTENCLGATGSTQQVTRSWILWN